MRHIAWILSCSFSDLHTDVITHIKWVSYVCLLHVNNIKNNIDSAPLRRMLLTPFIPWTRTVILLRKSRRSTQVSHEINVVVDETTNARRPCIVIERKLNDAA